MTTTITGVGRDVLIDRIRSLEYERDALIARAEKAEADAARLTTKVAELTSGIVIRGWWCLPCSSFNGEEHSKRHDCRSCGRPKTARITEVTNAG